jgi:hypothetical protein
LSLVAVVAVELIMEAQHREAVVVVVIAVMFLVNLLVVDQAQNQH